MSFAWGRQIIACLLLKSNHTHGSDAETTRGAALPVELACAADIRKTSEHVGTRTLPIQVLGGIFLSQRLCTVLALHTVRRDFRTTWGAYLAPQIHHSVLHHAVEEPQHPQKHYDDTYPWEYQGGVGTDGAQQHGGTKQQWRQHGQAGLADHQPNLHRTSTVHSATPLIYSTVMSGSEMPILRRTSASMGRLNGLATGLICTQCRKYEPSTSTIAAAGGMKQSKSFLPRGAPASAG